MRATALKMVHELARQDPRVVFIGSDLGAGTMAEMAEQFPERTFMEGISEANIVGMAAGMAMEGYIPYLNTIAPFFTRRAFEQIAVDLCLQNLPVRLIASGGGLVYAPLGPTHMAIEDIAVMRALPNMTVVAVSDAEEMRRLMAASLAWPGPLYIRVAKGGARLRDRQGDRVCAARRCRADNHRRHAGPRPGGGGAAANERHYRRYPAYSYREAA